MEIPQSVYLSWNPHPVVTIKENKEFNRALLHYIPIISLLEGGGSS